MNAATDPPLKERFILIKGAGEMATGIASCLYRANLKRLLLLETAAPMAVRRGVSFCEAIHEQQKVVEGITAVKIVDDRERAAAWAAGQIAVQIDPQAECLSRCRPDVVVDAILAKRNLGTAISDARLVIALGPGFSARRDCHLVVETNRGHDLGRLIRNGSAAANTGIPGNIGGYTTQRVLRAPTEGMFVSAKNLGDRVTQGETIGQVDHVAVIAELDGVLRGLIRPGCQVRKGLKIGDIDPRGQAGYCTTISDKARTLGGAVLGAIMAVYN